MNTPTETPKRYQCRHIFTDGRRCGSPCLRHEPFCYYHHTSRKPAPHPNNHQGQSSTFELPLPEDRSAIQHSIGQVLQRIAANDIDPRRAGLLLYGLQIASLNLPNQPIAKHQPETVEEITTDPELGLLAPPAEVGQAGQRKSAVAQLLERMLQSDEIPSVSPETTIIPTLQATQTDSSTPSIPKSFIQVLDRLFPRWLYGAVAEVTYLRVRLGVIGPYEEKRSQRHNPRDRLKTHIAGCHVDFCCYSSSNASKYIAQTIRSVLEQTLPADEVLVIDDGSTDDTAAIAVGFGPPVRVIRIPNSKLPAARNRGVREAKANG